MPGQYRQQWEGKLNENSRRQDLTSLLPPPSHCQKRTHLGFRGDTALRGQLKMPRHLFCRRFYFVSEKERKVKLWLATPGASCFFAPPLVGSLGDRGPKQAAKQLVVKKAERELEGGRGAILPHPHPSLLPTQSFSLLANQDEPHADLFNLHLLQVKLSRPPLSISLPLLPKKECRKIKRPNRGEVNSISLNTRLYG